MRTLGCFLVALVVATAAYAQSKEDPKPTDIRSLEKETSLHPDSPAVWQKLGLAQYRHEHFELAINAFEHALRLAPKDPQITNNLGFAYLFSKRLEDAISSFKTTLDLDSHFFAAHRGLCSAYSLARRSQDAVEMCLIAIKEEDSGVPLYFLGHTYLDLGDELKAVATFEDAARFEPRSARIFVGLGFAYYSTKDYNHALTALEHAKAIDPNADELWSGLGLVYARLHEYKKAEEVLREALAREPDNVTDHFNLGAVCLLRKNRDCALSEYNYLRIKNDPRAQALFGSIYSSRVIDARAYKPRP